jgi:hypothetical protein
MKKFLCFLVLTILTVSIILPSVVFAQDHVQQAGYAYTPVTQQYTKCSGTSTSAVVWDPAPGAKIVLMGGIFNSDTATRFALHTTSAQTSPYINASASGIVAIGSGSPIWKGAVDEDLKLTTITAGSHVLYLWGYED